MKKPYVNLWAKVGASPDLVILMMFAVIAFYAAMDLLNDDEVASGLAAFTAGTIALFLLAKNLRNKILIYLTLAMFAVLVLIGIMEIADCNSCGSF